MSFYKNNKQVNNTKPNIRNLFKCIPLVSLKSSISNCLFFGLYNTYKTDNIKHNITLTFGASFISTLIPYPVDTIRVNCQTCNNKSLTDIFHMTKHNLFKGFGLKLTRSILGKTFVMTSYEYLKNI